MSIRETWWSNEKVDEAVLRKTGPQLNLGGRRPGVEIIRHSTKGRKLEPESSSSCKTLRFRTYDRLRTAGGVNKVYRSALPQRSWPLMNGGAAKHRLHMVSTDEVGGGGKTVVWREGVKMAVGEGGLVWCGTYLSAMVKVKTAWGTTNSFFVSVGI